MQVDPSPFRYKVKSGSHQGEPCKQGWTHSATGCNPASEEANQQSDKIQANASAESSRIKDNVKLPEDGTIRKRLIVPIGSNKGVPLYLLEQTEQLNLDKNQIKAIQEYAYEDQESPTGYYQLNKKARECPDTLDCLDESQKRRFMELDKLASTEMSESALVYRGLNEEAGNAFMELMNTTNDKDAIQLPGIMSTSICPYVASNFGTKALLEIKASTGLYIDPVRNGGGEREVIKSPNKKYRLIGVQQKQKIQMGRNPGDGDREVTIIQMEEI